jgi:beta-xylosidase
MNNLLSGPIQRILILLVSYAISTVAIFAQITEEDSVRTDAVWIPDNGDGTYTNPVLYADYSDPDIVKVGEDFYMVTSSFNCVPGVPVLHSKDLVNWNIIAHVFSNQPPDSIYDKPGHGVGVWAPSIRYHNGEFYVYYADPDYGIYLGKATDPAGPWEHKLVQSSYGWIDPCPFWDDNDSAYLVHAYAKSRVGFNSILTLRRMSQDGETISLIDTIVLFDGNDPSHPRQTIEGPKMYKRNGYYYVFAPYGGVANGSQAVLRADTVFGPYQDSTVLERGSTSVNGPHQGGWVELESGESWFMHFQEKLPYGRIGHLQPMQWIDDWPFIGEDHDGDGIGEPVYSHSKPDVGASFPIMNPQTSDKFDSEDMALQWQWHSNIDSSCYSLSDNSGKLRMNAVELPENYINLWDVGSMLLQKLPAVEFSVITKVDPELNTGETTGLLAMGINYTYIGITKTDTGLIVRQRQCYNAEGKGVESTTVNMAYSVPDTSVFLRMTLSPGGKCDFSYSIDGVDYQVIGRTVSTDEGKWIGAKVGLFCHRPFENAGEPGYADYEWFDVDYKYTQEPGLVHSPDPGDGDSIFVDSGIQLLWDGDLAFTDSFYVYLDTQTEPLIIAGKTKSPELNLGQLETDQTYYWRVDAKNDLGLTRGPVWSFTAKEAVIGIHDLLLDGFSLEQNQPNPFSVETRIRFSIPETTQVKLKLYSLQGNLVEVIADRSFNAGDHSILFSRKDIPAGTYFLTMEVANKTISKQLVVK